MKIRLGIWAALLVAVVLATRTIVYALAPQSLLLEALSHDEDGPDVTVPLVAAVLLAAAFAAAVLGLAVTAVRERVRLEGRRVLAAPRLRPALLAARLIVFFAVSSFGFAMLESTIHWREGLGWHGLHCLVGPVHRDAIPILVALSSVAVGIHGAIEHLLAWARRLVAQLVARVLPVDRSPCLSAAPATPPPSRQGAANAARGPPPRLCL